MSHSTIVQLIYKPTNRHGDVINYTCIHCICTYTAVCIRLCMQTNKHTNRTTCTCEIACTAKKIHICTHRSIYTVATTSLLAGCHSTERCTDLGLPHISLCQGWRGLKGNDTISEQKVPPTSYPTVLHPAPPPAVLQSADLIGLLCPLHSNNCYSLLPK